jgi:hypothetical protein
MSPEAEPYFGAAASRAAARFKLSRAETQLLHAIISGRSLAQSAVHLGRALNTVRTGSNRSSPKRKPTGKPNSSRKSSSASPDSSDLVHLHHDGATTRNSIAR